MDPLEKAGLDAAAAGGSRTITLNTPIKDDPNLEAIRQGLQRDYTAKTQEAKREREMAEQLLQQAQLIHQQAQLGLQSQQQARPPQVPSTPSLVEAFEQKFGTELDPASRQTLGFLAEYLGQPQLAQSRELEEMKRTMVQLVQQAQQSHTMLQAVAVRPELEALTDKFGEEEIQKRLPQVANLMRTAGLSFKAALAASDPDFFAERMGQDKIEQQKKATDSNDARIRALMGNGSLEGVVPSPNGQSDNEPQFVPGESFEESMKKLLGVSAYNSMLANDAISRG